jgi:hypothetical protein
LDILASRKGEQASHQMKTNPGARDLRLSKYVQALNTPVTEAETAAMLKQVDLTISAQSAIKQPFTKNVSVAGFSAAYAKIK